MQTGLIKNPKAGFVYFLRELLQGSIKIGYSRNLENRLVQFGVALPFDVELVHVIYSLNVEKTEKLLHTHFGEKRLNGEWFKLSEDDLMIIRKMDFPGHILTSIIEGGSIAPNFSVSSKSKPAVIPVQQSKPETKLKEIPIDQISFHKFKMKQNKLDKHKNEIKQATGAIVKVKKNKDKFEIIGSPYPIAAAKELKRKKVLVYIVEGE